MRTVSELSQLLGKDPFDWQKEAFEADLQDRPDRQLLYYRTGAGKSITSLGLLFLREFKKALVIAPPSTAPEWTALAGQLGMEVEVVSHAKFRMKDFAPSRYVPVIADEFHLFGGHGGIGWKKLLRLSRGLQAPMILCSATPNYNDAERCYCVQSILDPVSTKGGYLQFLYTHCITEQNQFGATPKVLGFQRFSSAADYLSSLPHVRYLPDNVTVVIHNVRIKNRLDSEFVDYGYNRRAHRVMASQMEEKHAASRQNLIGPDWKLWPEVYDELTKLVGQATTPVLIYANTETVAVTVWKTASLHKVKVALVTGKTPKTVKNNLLEKFRQGEFDVLVGTATLATGTDGLDKVCDTMIIVQDTDDPALRRQLVGRILPRGDSVDVSSKQFFRLVPDL